MRPNEQQITEENEYRLRRHRNFRHAAEQVAQAYGNVAGAERIALIGSVALPLKKEIPQHGKYRRAGVEMYHHCKDVDLAVWLSDQNCLRSLQKARNKALNQLQAETRIGVAHHQVDTFLLENKTDRYLGFLCEYGKCPKDKRECREYGCGQVKFLKINPDFVFYPDTLKPDRIVLLYGPSPKKRYHSPTLLIERFPGRRRLTTT